MAKKKSGGGQTKLQRAKQISGMTGPKASVDKTFGMKNKKGAKAGKIMQNLNMAANNVISERQKMKELERKRQEQEERDMKMLGGAYTKATKKKGPKKKKGEEDEGDANSASKSAKRDLYSDDRDEGDEKKADTMDGWDTEKLNSVVDSKHGKDKNAKTTTMKICRHFLKAVEKGQYGWFWECADGAKCKYRHALPPGFVLKKSKEEEDEEEQISLSQLIEEERSALVKNLKPGQSLTKVTEDTFKAWKKKKILEKKVALRKEMKKKKEDADVGKVGNVSGRELFALGHARGAETDDGDGGGASEVDYKALRKAAEADANADAPVGDAAAKQPTAFAIDNQLFAMDLGDLSIDNIPDDFFDKKEEKAADTAKGPSEAGATEDAKEGAAEGGAGATKEDAAAPASDAAADSVAVDTALFAGDDLGLGDLDLAGMDDEE